jgi:hypothetical protein
MRTAACPWRLKQVWAHVPPMRWMLAVELARLTPAARTVPAVRPTQFLQVTRLARPAHDTRATQ